MSTGDPSLSGSSFYYQVPPPEIDYERLAEEIVKRLPPQPPMYPYYVPYYPCPVYPTVPYPTYPTITWTFTNTTDTSAGA